MAEEPAAEALPGFFGMMHSGKRDLAAGRMRSSGLSATALDQLGPLVAAADADDGTRALPHMQVQILPDDIPSVVRG